MNTNLDDLPPEIAAAYRDGKARGLPSVWTVEIDKRNRRKWTAPNGRSCDSIPKALAISVELGLLPKDFKVEHGKRKRSGPGKPGRPPKKAREAHQQAEEEEEDENDYIDYEDPNEPPPEPMDPEESLDGRRKGGYPTTVHWNPNDAQGRKVGWKIRVLQNDHWYEGRVIRYDPFTHKHRIDLDNGNSYWIWLRNEQHNLQLATRIVWAHVKGYAWWPALVMESNSTEDRRDGYVLVEFFYSKEVSTLRDSDECIRKFDPSHIDPVVAKHKKKRNNKAFEEACEEYQSIAQTRRDAAVYYATKAIGMSNIHGKDLIGKRIQVFRSDVNYPDGDIVVGRVRKYSTFQKKWLVSFEMSEKTRNKYEAAWINLTDKQARLQVLSKKKNNLSEEDLVPYIFGFVIEDKKITETVSEDDRDAILGLLLKERCRGCLEYWKKGEVKATCEECDASYHLGCFDPPLSLDTWQRMLKEGAHIICSHCTTCRGCYQKDIAFGSHMHPVPPSLSFLPGEQLYLCSMCKDAYETDHFCPNCAHTWDDVKFDKMRRQIEWNSSRRKKRLGRSLLEDTTCPILFGHFDGDYDFPVGAKVDPSWYYPETSEWGYTEVEMLVCDTCKVWVHAGCAGIGEDEYNEISDGNHPIYSKEFLCRICCRKRCKEIVRALNDADNMMLFATPVTEKVAPNYRDVIKHPMDLQTMLERANSDEYLNYAWVREMFELMVLNALTYNRYYTRVWNEAKRYYLDCLKRIFGSIGKAAPPGKYDADIKQIFKDADEYRKMELDRVQVDDTAEKKDLVVGSMATTIALPKLRDAPPDQTSCVPFTEVKLKPVDAFFCSWIDCCFTCGSSGAADTMLFCVDCGEAFHSFCVNAPVHSMELSSVAGWRCPNCKICEISGEVPQEETKMLFCEMCDRAFTLDLLEPPLQAAPPGLWICGQCVDCRSCGNRFDTNGASTMHWSRDPDKCFRCGGCSGLFDETEFAKCCICDRWLHKDETELNQCTLCQQHVHRSCDISLQVFDDIKSTNSRRRGSLETYICPSCHQCEPIDLDALAKDRLFLFDQAWNVINNGLIPHEQDISEQELHSKLTQEIDMQIRDQWRDEYLTVIREGVRICFEGRNTYGDPRIVVQHAFAKVTDLPRWMIQRALRFLVLAKRYKWESESIDKEPIEKLLFFAKLASAFLWVACRAMSIDMKKNLLCFDRVERLAEAPDAAGIVVLPLDNIRPKVDGILTVISNIKTDQPFNMSLVREPTVSSKNSGTHLEQKVKVASPLRGWVTQGRFGEWKDPRECCLCHLCGDDDAGLHDPKETLLNDEDDSLPSLGRLLPMANGYWVHTFCALWSSEVWEAPSDGFMHAVEKAKGRGAQLKCFGCGRYGATVGCNKGNCNYNYHFPCAKVCGVVFTADQQVFCCHHRSSATGLLPRENFELMKSLMVAPEKKSIGDKDSPEPPESDTFARVGALVVHSLGNIETNADGFHTENYITPPGYFATRIFWSCCRPRERTVYILRIDRTIDEKIQFSVTPGDDSSIRIVSSSVSQVYTALMDRVGKVNAEYFSQGNRFSKLPIVRRTRRKTFGLNGAQFFGFGLNHIRRALEASPGVEATVAPLTASSPKYRFCFTQPTVDAILDLQRKRAAKKAEQALENSSGCARTEGIKAVACSGGSGRITRALVRSAEEEVLDATSMTKKAEDKALADRSINQMKYKRMTAIPLEQRLAARRSHIHGWGLFTKLDVEKDDPVVEYMGEIIRQPVADKREHAYELSGEGSCYMFRLDLQRIVDATMIGCMARFMNHSCHPNAYAKIITVDTELGQDKKIVVFANRKINAGEEITYDYKFPVEDGSLRCMCGAPNCIGRLN